MLIKKVFKLKVFNLYPKCFSSRASTEPNPADEQLISADSTERLRPDLPIDNNYNGLTLDKIFCRTRALNI